MRAFYRRPIAFASFLAVLTGLVSYQLNARIKLWFVLIFVALSLLALVPVLLRRGGKRVIELLICLVAISVSFVSSYLFFDVRYQSYQNLAEQTVEVEGTVLERRSTTTFMTTFRVSLDRINGDDVSADAIIECNYQSAMQVGDTFSIKGTVRDFEKSELFDEEQFYISDGCLLIVTCDTYYDCEIGEPNHSSLRVIASKINASISNRLSVRMGREEGSLAAALLLSLVLSLICFLIAFLVRLILWLPSRFVRI